MFGRKGGEAATIPARLLPDTTGISFPEQAVSGCEIKVCFSRCFIPYGEKNKRYGALVQATKAPDAVPDEREQSLKSELSSLELPESAPILK